MAAARFGPDGQIRFLQRGWANANSVLIVGDQPALIDSGHTGYVDELTTLIAGEGVDPRALRLLVNTHSHWDHTGGNAALRDLSGATLAMGVQTAEWMAAGDRHALWLSYFDVDAPLTTADRTLSVGETIDLGGLPFEVLALPGHAPDLIGFWQPEARLLVAADAVLPGGDCGILNVAVHGFEVLDRADETLRQIVALDPAVILPGHGAPILNVASNLAALQRRLARLRANPADLARHLARRVLLAYLLESAAFTPDALQAQLATATWVQDYAPLAGCTPQAFVAETLGVLLRGRLLTVENGILVCHIAR